MWAYRMSAPSTFEAAEVDAPDPAALRPGQVLLRTLAGGICGSDLPKFRGLKPPDERRGTRAYPGRPGYPMHEIVGEVVASRHPSLACGTRAVGWAVDTNAATDLVVTDGDHLAAYDPALAPEAAVLIQSIACVLYAVGRLPVRGKHVAVLGLGPIGLLFTHALRTAGAARVTGVDVVDRTDVADSFGIDEFVHAATGDWAAAMPEFARPGVVVEAVGHQVSTLQHAVEAVADEGHVLYFGIPDDDRYPLDMQRLMRRNLTLTGGITRRRHEMLRAADQYLRECPDLYTDLVTNVYPVVQIQRAFDRAATNAPDRRKVLVTMR